MRRDLEINEEISQLQRRISDLEKLLALRLQVSRLEAERISGIDTQRVMNVISEQVCLHFNINLERIMSRRRDQYVVVPRQVVFYLARSIAAFPYHAIGQIFSRDHGTVIYGCQSIRERLETQPEFARAIASLEVLCKQKLEHGNEKIIIIGKAAGGV